MKNSSNDSAANSSKDRMREAGGKYALSLPVDATLPSTPPKGCWEDGYRLSLLALEAVRDRPEVFVERDRRACLKEFKL